MPEWAARDRLGHLHDNPGRRTFRPEGIGPTLFMIAKAEICIVENYQRRTIDITASVTGVSSVAVVSATIEPQKLFNPPRLFLLVITRTSAILVKRPHRI